MPMKSWTTSNTNKPREERWDEKVRMGTLTHKYKNMRPVGGFWPYAQHWFEIYSKKKEGFVKFPLICNRFDPETESYDHERECAACDAYAEGEESLKPQKVNAANFIDRELQQKNDSNPIVVLRINYTQTQDIEGIVDIIKRDPADPESGVDLAMKYDDSLTGRDRYSTKRGEDTPLTEEELEYELYELDEIIQPAAPSRILDAVSRVLAAKKKSSGSSTTRRTKRAAPPPRPEYEEEEIVGIPDFDDDEDELPF